VTNSLRLLRPLAALGCAAVLASCYEKNAVQEIAGPPAGSMVKFFHFGVNAPGVHFYANSAKVTAINSATGVESTVGTTYGGVGLGGLYSAIAPGTYDFTGRIAATVDKDLVIATVPATLATGSRYSVYLSGFYNATTKTVEGFVIEDVLPNLDWNVAYVRFVHAISNGNPMTLYATSTTAGSAEVAIGGEVAYRSGGAFVSLPTGVYNLATRYAGSATNAITRTNVSFVAGRTYTIGARGDITVVSTTATNRPFLDNTLNR
jgi:hypothetical protein